MYILMENKSLHTLNLSRKKLTDIHAKQIAEMLKQNTTLRRLELEGNNFGPDAAKYFSEALKVNKTLRYLDLENNNLGKKKVDRKDKKDDEEYKEKKKMKKVKDHESSGIEAIFVALQENKMLISLNLNNNYIGQDSGQNIIDCLKENKILIHLDIGLNQMFDVPEEEQVGEKNYESKGIEIDKVIKIKEMLNENRSLYDKMRLKEWKERKGMENEFNDIRNYNTVIEEKLQEKDIKISDKDNIEDYYVNKFIEETNKMEKRLSRQCNCFSG